MNRLYLAVGALVVIVVLSFTSCTLYKGKVAASVKADIATKVVTKAVAASQKQVVRDYKVQGKKAVALDSVRASTEKLRNYKTPTPKPEPVKDYNATQKPEEAAPVAGASDPWIGVFNDAVRRTNRAISDSVGVP